MLKYLPASAGDAGAAGLTLGWEDPLEEEMATRSSIPARKYPMDRGAWCAIVHWVRKSQPRLSE